MEINKKQDEELSDLCQLASQNGVDRDFQTQYVVFRNHYDEYMLEKLERNIVEKQDVDMHKENRHKYAMAQCRALYSAYIRKYGSK